MSKFLQIKGAKTHNLKNIDVEIPLYKIIVVAGVSGSRKSSLVFDTIAATATLEWNENYPAYTRNLLPNVSRPEVSSIRGLPPTITIGQEAIRQSSRSTVGTLTGANPFLRLLFSRMGNSVIEESSAFSFNHARRMV